MSSVGMDDLFDFDWDAPFDFESFINFAAEDDDQGDQAGSRAAGPFAESDPLEDTEQRQGLQIVKDIDDSGFAGDRSSNPLTIDAHVGDATLPEETLQNHGFQQYPSTLPSAPSRYKSEVCTCFDCLKITQYWSQLKMDARPSGTIHCRIPGCDVTNKVELWRSSEQRRMCNHEKGHFMEKRPDSSLVCTQAYCKFTTKRQSDLRRHYRSMHCSNPQIFSCPVPWCKYSGDNGFARKDKLTSHYKNVHQGNLGRGQPLRALQPATPAFPASENETGGVYGSGSGLAGSATQEQDHVL